LQQRLLRNTRFQRLKQIVSLNHFFEIVKDEVNKEGIIQLSGFGSFKKVERPARTGRNPLTGKAIKIPKKNAVKFTPAKAFKEFVN
jgi:DNA-binding protein HU-alpha